MADAYEIGDLGRTRSGPQRSGRSGCGSRGYRGALSGGAGSMGLTLVRLRLGRLSHRAGGPEFANHVVVAFAHRVRTI